MFFSQADIGIRNAILPASVKNDTPNVAANSTDQGSDTRSVATSPQASYATYHLQHSTGSSNDKAAINGEMLIDDNFTQFYNDVHQPAFDTISQKLGTTAEDLLKLISDMSLDNLRVLLADIADTLISVMATIV